MNFASRILAAALLLAAPAAFAQSTVTLSGQTAGVTLEAGLTLTSSTSLSFGKLVLNGTLAGTAVLSNSGSLTSPNGVTAAPAGGSSVATFAVTGAPSQSVAITIPPTISLTGTGAPMTITTTNDAGTALTAGGAMTFHIGGSLAIGANQTVGAYTGTYQVTVAYN